MPKEIREQFRRHGRDGGRARVERMNPDARRAVARRAATTRWIRERFGGSSFEALGLPGGEMIDTGLADLAEGKETEESLLVSLAASRLRREGVPIGQVHSDPEDRLYDLLSRSSNLAHAPVGAYLRQATSFADACHAARIDQRENAR